ncbi:MAG: adenylate/guanylate cyclase domain-containing protein [Azospirillaceae bacterium]|nr:adenylate/guanylate cyclase domain-containing protein [Azospirillaceae bacterium]
MTRATTQDWTWTVPGSAERIWSAFGNTGHFNEALGLPTVRVEEIVHPDGGIRRLAEATVRGRNLKWQEPPYEWVRGRWFRQRRDFTQGPFRRLGLSLEVADTAEGCRVHYALAAEPAGLPGRLLLAAGFLERSGRRIERLARSAGDFAVNRRDQPFEIPPAIPTAAATARVAAIVREMVATDRASGGASAARDDGLARRLGDLVLFGANSDLSRIRPLALARQWAVEPRRVIELCLSAVKAGLLELRWELLCPRCRGATVQVGSLDRLPKGAHCPSCNIPYDAEFSQNVELTLGPAPAIRRTVTEVYCLSGPMLTPHVWAQQLLAPGEDRAVVVDLPSGPWRFRTLEPGTSASIDLTFATPPLGVSGDGTAVTVTPVTPRGGAAEGTIQFWNRSGRPLTFIVESRHWVADALTAHRATTLQAFRDLCPDQILRPGDDIAIGQVTLMFTDLRQSTALYGRVGDATAYHMVRNHFAMLAERIRDHDGAVVKTIGDAVMAAFAEPADALAAALAIQTRPPGDGLVIRLGLHTGPCVAVTLNGRLDYFGSTVNLAARLEGCGHGGDVVISQSLAMDPAISTVLAPLDTRAEIVTLKGFDKPIGILRIHPGTGQNPGPTTPG